MQPGLAKLLALLVGLVLGVGVVEVGLRMHAGSRAKTFPESGHVTADKVADPLLGIWFKPDYQAAEAKYDRYGFRLNGQPRLDPGPRPIALLGGSTAYGWGMADDETIAAVLERTLRQGGHGQAVVVNAGFPGLTTLDSLLVYHSKVAPLRPSTVIVLAGLNDLFYAVDWGPKHRMYWLNNVFEVSLRARQDPALQPVVEAVDTIALRDCFSCYYASAGLSRLFDRTGFGPALTFGQVLGQQPMASPNERAMQLTAWGLQELALRVRSDGGCLVVAWQPMVGLHSRPRTAGEQTALEDLTRKVPAWPTVAPRMFADLLAATRPVFDSGAATEVGLTNLFDDASERLFVDDGVHYNPEGNRRIAQALAPAVSAGCTL